MTTLSSFNLSASSLVSQVVTTINFSSHHCFCWCLFLLVLHLYFLISLQVASISYNSLLVQVLLSITFIRHLAYLYVLSGPSITFNNLRSPSKITTLSILLGFLTKLLSAINQLQKSLWQSGSFKSLLKWINTKLWLDVSSIWMMVSKTIGTG